MVGMGLLKSQLKSLFMWKEVDECEEMPGKHNKLILEKKFSFFKFCKIFLI